MADRSIILKLGLNISGLAANARAAGKELSNIGSKGLNWVGKNEQSINTLSTGLGRLGLVAVAGAAIAVNAYAKFDQQMSFVAATGDDARASLDELRDAAIDAGARTAFSATEAAQGIEELAKAGVSAADILGGGLDGALDLAAAGGLEVGEAAEIAATAMTQFGLSGEDVTHIADLLAAGAGKAQGSVSDMGMALKQAGLVADQTGLSIEETVGGLTAFAAAGLLGSDAGTSMKSMLQRLTPTSKEAAAEMERLGISAYDSGGNFIGLSEFAGNLQSALKDLTPEQRNAAMATIFGSDAVRAASILYEEGESGIRDWISAVDDQGFAAETAATRMDNLRGDLEQLGGALESAFIGMGEGADGPLRKLVQTVTDAVNAFNGLSAPVKTAMLAIVGGGGLVALGLAGLGKLVVGISNTRDALGNLSGVSGRAAKALKFVGVVGAVTGVVTVVKQLSDALADVDAVGFGEASEALAKLRRGATSELVNTFVELSAALEDNNKWLGFIPTTLGGWTSSAKDSSEVNQQWAETAGAMDDALSQMVGSGDLEGAAESIAGLGEQLGLGNRAMAAFVEEHFPMYADALAAQRAEAEATGVAQGEMSGAIDGTTGSFAEQEAAAVAATEALTGYLDELRKATDPVFALNTALLGVEEAQTAYNDAVTQYGVGSAEAQQAALDLAGSIVELESAALNGDLSFEQFSTKLDQWVASGQITAGQADDIRARVASLTGVADDYKGRYNADITERGAARATRSIGVSDQAARKFGRLKAEADLSVDRSRQQRGQRNANADLRSWGRSRGVATIEANDRASGTLGYVQRLINGIKSKTVDITANYKSTGTMAKAKGGPIRARGSYLVGEEGPELITPTQSGFVHTAPRTAAIMGRQSMTTMSAAPVTPAAASVTAGSVVRSEAVVTFDFLNADSELGRALQKMVRTGVVKFEK